MKKFLFILFLSLLVLGLLPLNSFAKVIQTLDKTYLVGSAPVDISGSADGKYTFILTQSGNLVIQVADGDQEEIHVGEEFDKIHVSPTGDKVYLSSRATKKIQEVFIDFQHQFDISKSPYLGEKNAPVVITVFSDFQ